MKYEINYFGNLKVAVQPRVELYNVSDFMGTPMHGIAIVLDEIGNTSEKSGQFAVLTVSFGEFIGMKNCAYIDINNCPWANQLLQEGFAEDTGFTHESGFCTYPLWHFHEDFLKEHGEDNYAKYSDGYDKYMASVFETGDEDEDDLSEGELNMQM